MTPTAQHRAWLVDLDGTLYSPRPLKLVMAAELLLFGLPHLGAIRAFRAEHERIREEELEGDSSPFALQLELAAKRCQLPPEALEAKVREWMIRRPCRWLPRFRRGPLIEEIKSFRSSGGRSALVSDYPARDKLAALQASELFDAVVANGEAGGPTHLKPNPAGYLAAARELDVSPSECLVIGDRDDADGEAARRAGMDFRLV